jgi:hypothetical protein
VGGGNDSPPRESAAHLAPAPVEETLRPRGLVDLRGRVRGPSVLAYPAGAVVVVSGLPGSGKSTLMRRWSGSAPVIDPRTVHVEYQARMPGWLPYAVYRPWVRLQHFLRLRAQVQGGGPLLVHDCGSRPWMRRRLARAAGRQRRELHVVLLAVDAVDALAGQDKRGRWVPARVFARHRRGLAQLLSALSVQGAAIVPEAASVVLLDRTLREHVAALEFAPSGPVPPPPPSRLPVPVPLPQEPGPGPVESAMMPRSRRVVRTRAARRVRDARRPRSSEPTG